MDAAEAMCYIIGGLIAMALLSLQLIAFTPETQYYLMRSWQWILGKTAHKHQHAVKFNGANKQNWSNSATRKKQRVPAKKKRKMSFVGKFMNGPCQSCSRQSIKNKNEVSCVKDIEESPTVDWSSQPLKNGPLSMNAPSNNARQLVRESSTKKSCDQKQKVPKEPAKLKRKRTSEVMNTWKAGTILLHPQTTPRMVPEDQTQDGEEFAKNTTSSHYASEDNRSEEAKDFSFYGLSNSHFSIQGAGVVNINSPISQSGPKPTASGGQQNKVNPSVCEESDMASTSRSGYARAKVWNQTEEGLDYQLKNKYYHFTVPHTGGKVDMHFCRIKFPPNAVLTEENLAVTATDSKAKCSEDFVVETKAIHCSRSGQLDGFTYGVPVTIELPLDDSIIYQDLKVEICYDSWYMDWERIKVPLKRKDNILSFELQKFAAFRVISERGKLRLFYSLCVRRPKGVFDPTTQSVFLLLHSLDCKDEAKETLKSAGVDILVGRQALTVRIPCTLRVSLECELARSCSEDIDFEIKRNSGILRQFPYWLEKPESHTSLTAAIDLKMKIWNDDSDLPTVIPGRFHWTIDSKAKSAPNITNIAVSGSGVGVQYNTYNGPDRLPPL